MQNLIDKWSEEASRLFAMLGNIHEAVDRAQVIIRRNTLLDCIRELEVAIKKENASAK